LATIGGPAERGHEVTLTVDAPRLYALPGAPDATPGEMLLLTLTTAATGQEVFSFTFESCLDGCGRGPS
jgi:hypothetical protein